MGQNLVVERLLHDAEVVLEAPRYHSAYVVFVLFYFGGLTQKVLFDPLPKQGSEASLLLLSHHLTLWHLLASRCLHEVEDCLLELLVMHGLSLLLSLLKLLLFLCFSFRYLSLLSFE
jgi:hypothetical protein